MGESSQVPQSQLLPAGGAVGSGAGVLGMGGTPGYSSASLSQQEVLQAVGTEQGICTWVDKDSGLSFFFWT